jgi:hypothetical protein
MAGRDCGFVSIRNSQFAILVILWCLLAAACARNPLAISIAQPIISPLIPSPKPSMLFLEPFHVLDPQRWREVEVDGQTHYTVEALEGEQILKAHSRSGASILLCPFRFDPDIYEWLSWRWRVDRLVEEEDLSRKGGSDAAARVYVYFATQGLPWQKRNIDYVWSAHLPVGTLLSSAYSGQSKILVVDSGPAHLGKWRTVNRNIEEDYERCFGQDPPDVVAIGLMVDTDNTRSEALAYFDDLMISRNKPPTSSFKP